MITFDILTLNEFLKENIDFITNSRISKIQQPTRREFVLALRNNGETRSFYVNINPQFYHCCFMNKINYKKRVLEIPQKPPMFCMLLRKYLENSRIAKVEQPTGERILEFYIETYNELGEKIYLCLAFEFMGKHSNVILYNTDTNIIIGCAHNVGSEKSREREIYGGIPYVYPPKNRDIGKKWTSLTEYIPLNDTVNDYIDNYYADIISQYKFKSRQSTCRSIVTQKHKKLTKSLMQIKKQLSETENADKYRLYGDLIMANLYNLSDYVNLVKVFDYENNKEITIELDSLKTLKENANKFYKLYNKSKVSRVKLTEIIEKYESERIYLEQILYSIDCALCLDDLEEIMPELEGKKSSNKKSKVINIEQITTDDGSRIFIGKNNKQNDYIVSKLADDEDLWFHVHNCAGSHVLLKSENITDELILRCAKLAKDYSTAKNSKAGVIYTKRKYLRKPPGTKLGYVTYKNETEIIID